LQLICDKSVMHDANQVERIRRKYDFLDAVLDERSRRQWAATEAQELGYGGLSCVAKATGLARDTIRAGLHELQLRQAYPEQPVSPFLRRPGGGRKALAALDPELLSALESLVEPLTHGDPESPLRWTCKSTHFG
jgi:hypothetical protein